MPKTIYVTCKVAQGLFTGEFYVTVRSSSAYIDRANVKVNSNPHNGDEVDGRVMAYLVEEDKDNALIELPGEPVIGGLRTWVPKSELVAYA